MDSLREGYKPSEISIKLSINKYIIHNWKNGMVPPMAKWASQSCIELACVLETVEDGCVTKSESEY